MADVTTRIVYRRLKPAESLEDSKIIDRFINSPSGLEPVGGHQEWWAAFDGDKAVALASACSVDGGKAGLLSSCVVRKGYRSQGIQSRLISLRMIWAKTQPWERVWSYVYCENMVSLRNLVRAGFLPRKPAPKIRKVVGDDWDTQRYIWVEKSLK